MTFTISQGRTWTSDLGPRTHQRGELAMGTHEADAEGSFQPIQPDAVGLPGETAMPLSTAVWTLKNIPIGS